MSTTLVSDALWLYADMVYHNTARKDALLAFSSRARRTYRRKFNDPDVRDVPMIASRGIDAVTLGNMGMVTSVAYYLVHVIMLKYLQECKGQWASNDARMRELDEIIGHGEDEDAIIHAREEVDAIAKCERSMEQVIAIYETLCAREGETRPMLSLG
jgi:hypothetical protein